MKKPMNPYIVLKERFTEYVDACEYRHTKSMWLYPRDKLNNNWSLDDLYERVAAADQLGYNVELYAMPEGLIVKYIKKIPNRPWGI